MSRRVITYGTFDLLHQGHLNVLERAKALGDYLIVGVTSDIFDANRGKTNLKQNLLQRVEAIRKSGLADEIIVEEYVGQKISDIQRLDVDVFAIGSDWEGKFDYLSEYCQVVYLQRTEGISSTMLRADLQTVLKLGIVGCGHIAKKFIAEAKAVIGLDLVAVFSPIAKEAEVFTQQYGVPLAYEDLNNFMDVVEAVYIASPHSTHYAYVKQCLLEGKHVLCEIPLTLAAAEAEELFWLAQQRNLVLLEASKTAFCPAFAHLVNMVKSGVIGEVIDIQASLSILKAKSLLESGAGQAGGSMNELAPFALMTILKILGPHLRKVNFFTMMDRGLDVFTKGVFLYDKAIATMTLGLGMKTEGNLIVSGTQGYIYVPAPWWRTEYFELRFEDQNLNRKFFYPFLGEGLRYEIQEFCEMITLQRTTSFRLSPKESIWIADIIERFGKKENLTILS
ncbi:Gfo/Idh/MocA family oxidoreductase [Sphingobacterium ginsenosidimutans]|uniref:Glycerol-3-phosphate cytidylyltransferase n=1 Tax=Sphingobacterium ginsenosidimutans TaxID=687845 RepID=A0ABP7ZQQ7_9SPHI